MTAPTLLMETNPVARKVHRCLDCGGTIAPGVRYHSSRLAMDGSAYTLKSHEDCREAALAYVDSWDWVDPEDGIPPLHEMIADGDGQRDLDWMRGRWPHVVCRIELQWQLAEQRWRTGESAG